MALIVLDVALDTIHTLRPLAQQVARRDKALANQLRRSASSITLNIGEADYSEVAWRAVEALGLEPEVLGHGDEPVVVQLGKDAAGERERHGRHRHVGEALYGRRTHLVGTTRNLGRRRQHLRQSLPGGGSRDGHDLAPHDVESRRRPRAGDH